jgi:uncharacterized protein (DUF2147 family)
MKKLLFLLLIMLLSKIATAQHNSDDIIGHWMNTDNNLEVEVFKINNEYKAKVVWFDDSDDKRQPMNIRCDTKNPKEELRSRKIVGLEVMYGLVYNEDDDEWQHGRIYDSSSGKNWNAKAWLTKDGRLKVRGFWHFEFLGQNITFNKVS